MIAEWDTDTLFVSDRLETKEPALFATLRSVLNGVPIEHHPRHRRHLVPGLHADPD